MTDFAIILPVRDAALTLGAQLEAIARAAKPSIAYEVVIADNGSTDATSAVVAAYSGRLPVRTVDASDVAGAGPARNRAVDSTSATLLLFCDGDDEVDEQWIVAMLDALRSSDGLVGGAIDYTMLNRPHVCSWRGSSRSSVHRPLGFLPAAHSANMGVTRRLFEEVGGFASEFTIACEDIDFCWRAQLAGYRLREVPGAVVNYRLRTGLRELWRQAVAYSQSEALLYRRFRDAGLRRRPLTAVTGDIWWLITRAPLAVPIGRRGAWIRRLGQQWGRMRGSIRYRTWWW